MKALGCLLFLAVPLFAARVEIREGQFYVDHSLFYVRGVGYSPLRPHQAPGGSYTGINFALIDKDFERIRAARFNTLRTWEPLSREELALAKKHGLMVIQVLRLDGRQDFGKPANRENALAQARVAAETSKEFDNVLGYLILSKPHPSAIVDSGVEPTLSFFRDVKKEIQTIDPRPVSMDSWLPAAFMDHREFDFVSFTSFDFWPRSIQESLTFPGTLQWLKNRFAPDRPFLVSATGGYAVSEASRTANGGWGGLTEDEQSSRNQAILRQAVEGHASGSVLVSWIDSWAAAGDPNTHDNDPWEWTGVLGIETDSKRDKTGVPRKIYGDLTQANAAVVLEPKDNHLYATQEPLPIRAVSALDVMSARYSVNGGDWMALNGSAATGWYGFTKLPKTAKRRQRVSVQVMDKDQTVITQREVSFVAAMLPERVALLTERTKTAAGFFQFTADVKDGQGRALAKRPVQFGCFFPISLKESKGTVLTDASGLARWTCATLPAKDDRYMYIAAGTDSPDKIRTGDMRIFELTP